MWNWKQGGNFILTKNPEIDFRSLTLTFHSEILASWNFYKNKILSPGLGNNHTLKCCSGNNHTFKCWSGIFPTILSYVIMLENCQNNILVYGCSPIQGTEYYSCWNLMNPGSQSETYCDDLTGRYLEFGNLFHFSTAVCLDFPALDYNRLKWISSLTTVTSPSLFH